jgi:hypothetical protein
VELRIPLILSLCLACICAVAAQAQNTVITIDCPNATLTTVRSLNNKNWATGMCLVNNQYRSFRRTPAGQIEVFDVQNRDTFANDINDSNTVTGWFQVSATTVQGFVRSTAATEIFACPGATNTRPWAINGAGMVVGDCDDSSGTHGFLRDASGNITTFDPPGSTFTAALSINKSGVVAGTWYLAPFAFLGFIRDTAGNITTLQVPGSNTTSVIQINDSGAVTGQWNPFGGGRYQGYTRDSAGAFFTFSAPGSDPNGQTSPQSINSFGKVAGYATGSNPPYPYFGFTQKGSGQPVDFQVPNAVNFTWTSKVNDAGVLAGYYSDASTTHGFIGKP